MFSCLKKMFQPKNASCCWSHPPTQTDARSISTISTDANGHARTFLDAKMRRGAGDTLSRHSRKERVTTGLTVEGEEYQPPARPHCQPACSEEEAHPCRPATTVAAPSQRCFEFVIWTRIMRIIMKRRAFHVLFVKTVIPSSGFLMLTF
jgi:hypothetical protein